MKTMLENAAKKAANALQEYCDTKAKASCCQNFSGCEFCPVNAAYNMLREEAGETVIVSSIEWDTDEEKAEDLGLPSEVRISVVKLDDSGYTRDDIADYLSDEFGYCVKSFVTEEENDNED